MALLDVQLPNASADVVAVFGEGFAQVFESARPMKASYGLAKKVMEHPLEDGTTIADHQVILPVMIELVVLLSGREARSVFQQIKQVYTEGAIVTVQGRTETYRNMILAEMPYEETTERFDSAVAFLRFQEVKFAVAEYRETPRLNRARVADPKHADTENRGNQQGQPTRQSDAVRVYDKMKEYLKPEPEGQ